MRRKIFNAKFQRLNENGIDEYLIDLYLFISNRYHNRVDMR